MAVDKPAVALSRLRDLLAARVDAHSIRSVAREVGLPPNGLKYFLDGGTPRSGTRRKLEAWYLLEVVRPTASLECEEGRAALEILLRVLPPARRDIAKSRMLALLVSLCEEAGSPCPEWLRNPGNTSRDPER